MKQRLGQSEKTDESKLLIFGRKVLRKLFRPVKNSVINDWRVRKNKKIKQFYHKPNFMEIIRHKRLQ
jgi:hypothetical protein